MLDTAFLKKVLLEQHYISDEDVVAAEAFEKKEKGTFLEYLYQEGIVNKSTLGLAIAEHYGTTYTDLEVRVPSEDILNKIPASQAKKMRVILIEEGDDGVVVATDELDKKAAYGKKLATLFPKKKIRFTYAFPKSIDKALSFYETALNTRFLEILKKDTGVAPELFGEIIADALLYRASDIHFEPRQEKVHIRFRVDGVLRLAGSLPIEMYGNLLNRIKIEANLRTDEHSAAQDGAIRFDYEGKNIDLRVSIVPVIDGEKVVIRVLTEYIQNLGFSDLGFSDKHIELFKKVQSKPFGMIVVTGPTGSGKSTTLYSFVKQINRPEINVTTIEDPVEYYMAGANQIQVNQKTGTTFAKGLRSVVRQDPDVILLGEIRDVETAETAVNASLTGHMLLSTFHANNAATAIPRILDMGVEPFLLASTLELLVSQRLARKICESCRHSYVAKMSDLTKEHPGIEKYLGKKKTITLYKGEGCTACNHSGYNGRVAVVEAIEVDKNMKELINKEPSTDDIWKVAKKNGTESMFEDALKKAKLGLTSIEEVFRVTEIPS